MPITEDFPTGSTTNPYGTTKLIIERILTDVCKADPKLNVRPAPLLQPHRRPRVRPHRRGPQRHPQQPDALHRPGCHRQAGKAATSTATTTPPPTAPACGIIIHVVDLALRPCSSHEVSWTTKCGLFICNLGTGKGYSVLDVIHAFEKACGKKLPYVIDRPPPRRYRRVLRRPRQGQARAGLGRLSTASRRCAPTAGTGSRRTPTATTLQNKRIFHCDCP